MVVNSLIQSETATSQNLCVSRKASTHADARRTQTPLLPPPPPPPPPPRARTRVSSPHPRQSQTQSPVTSRRWLLQRCSSADDGGRESRCVFQQIFFFLVRLGASVHSAASRPSPPSPPPPPPPPTLVHMRAVARRPFASMLLGDIRSRKFFSFLNERAFQFFLLLHSSPNCRL